MGMVASCWTRTLLGQTLGSPAMASLSMVVWHGDGEAGIFWSDSWLAVRPLCHHAPHLFTAISRSGQRRTIKDALSNNRWVIDIRGALTTQVLCQYLQVWEMLRGVTLNPLQSDRFIWRWSADGKYFASSAYRAFFAGLTTLLGAQELWKARTPPRVKFFAWLALHNRLWTAKRQRRHRLQATDSCALCDERSLFGFGDWVTT